MNEVQCREYLKRIQFKGEVTDTAECLNELILAHLKTVPFENLEACEDHRVPSLEVDDLYQKIVEQKRGGWCFELNKLFYELLAACGFCVTPVAIRITWMKEQMAPLLHRATVVDLEERQYLCDVGYGGPGPKGLVELTDGEYLISGEWYQIQTGQGERKGTVIMKKKYHGEYHEMMRFQNEKAEEADYGIMNFYCAKAEASFFSSKAVINLYKDGKNYALIDRTMTIQDGEEKITKECCFEEKKEWLKKYFGIEK